MEILIVAVIVLIPMGWLFVVLVCDLISIGINAYFWISDRLHRLV